MSLLGTTVDENRLGCQHGGRMLAYAACQAMRAAARLDAD